MSALDQLPTGFTDIAQTAETRRRQLVERAQALTTDLPLRYLRQQAHFTTPASDLSMATKAVEGPLHSAARMFERFGLSRQQLAEAFDVPTASVDAVLDQPGGRAPLVLIDGEDAQALRDDVVLRGRTNAVQVFREAQWGSTLRFYRPSGLGLPYSVGDLVHVLAGAGEGPSTGSGRPEDYPIEGVMWPKAEHPEELAWLCDTLSAIENRLGLPQGRIRVQFLVESAWGLAQLPQLVKACVGRLCGIVFGISDYAADIGLLEPANGHPVNDHARMLLVNMAGAAGVPAIDNMTVNYPVADKALSVEANRARIVERLRECYLDARHGAALGMGGKWVGHPAQLFACLVAYREALSPARVAAEVGKVEAYQQAVAAERGATIIGGVMSDRANDRHSRALLRKALALGLLEPARAVALGVATDAEVQGL